MELKSILYPYQEQAVEKLIGIKVGALYMEMGTGKTRTALEIIHRRLSTGKIDKVLWLCPCSVKANLHEDISKHSENAPIIISGIETLSSSIKNFNALLKIADECKIMLIVDESNLVKNHQAIRTQRIEYLAKKCPYRLILNGTPISQNESDLYAQWKILDWRILGYHSFWAFAANHLEFDEKTGKVRRVLNIDYLTDKIKPYSFIIKKEDVLDLQPKLKYAHSFSLTPEQEKHYKKEMDIFLNSLIDLSDTAAIYRTFTALQEITSGRRIVSKVSESIRHEPFFESPMENPRLQLLVNLLDERKTIIWCKFQHEIEEVHTAIASQYGDEKVRLFYGAMSLSQREKSIKDFQETATFLVGNKNCAGYGLNLQFCNRAIYYNNDWSVATRLQSEDRLHRIGQENPVEIIDIYAAKTIDERILKSLERKEDLTQQFKAAIKEKNFSLWLSGVDVKGLEDSGTSLHK